MPNRTISEYDGSSPSNVMSVPCRVVIIRGTTAPGVDASTWRARYAAVA